MRYFFHLHNNIVASDEEGVELASEAEARDHAEAEARTMAAESVKGGSLDLSHYIRVSNEAQDTLFVVKFGDIVRIEQ